jgi:hypothetical protein
MISRTERQTRALAVWITGFTVIALTVAILLSVGVLH